MDINIFTNSVDTLAKQYNQTLESLQLEALSTHEYGQRWNEEQHKLLDKIKEETATFITKNKYNGTEEYNQLVAAARNILAANNIRITVIP